MILFRRMLSLSLALYMLISSSSASFSIDKVLSISGGLVPQANGQNGDYYEKYVLDYGSEDNRRMAGYLRGFLSSGSLSKLTEKDPFLKWLNVHLEQGPDGSPTSSGRLKPFYAADFGYKSDLPKGDNPKIIIVQRKLKVNEQNMLGKPSKEIDLEVKEVKNPFWRSRCNFAVRYIVPNRINIIKIMESKGRFKNEIVVEKNNKVVNNITFKPKLFERLKGKRNVVISRPLDLESK